MTVDELTDYGLERMDDDDIERFLATKSLGVLGLPTDGTPYLLPMSYGFDGDSRLYFVFVVGPESRKVDLTERAETVSFLVYSAETMFHWRSVLLTGAPRRLSEDEQSAVTDDEMPTWRPELLETASETEHVRIYELTVDEWTGLRHAIEPPTYAQRSARAPSE
ncbi:pyridoxamine 5'-phosphate oxidase family protein [Natrarchaeobius chitinivorans]|uniref:Pyridoxamine 5'-phosphate oxidase family protein n=1 Tax=Natrarchaeobius chitinivorans TaxID=1679083 RepID=A0A3N6MFH7_NATCH|nr:pyridoxamine 5'-phosphate oxidase family protein [Natrarchaeobius chitinivorans]RQG95490.1 pyridoxamine 5'-phosphate oxidase family protein [Natrarchaeobius chitinivorans]